jgi:hypothetical protein
MPLPVVERPERPADLSISAIIRPMTPLRSPRGTSFCVLNPSYAVAQARVWGISCAISASVSGRFLWWK